jgi:hypothetical protein
MVAASDGHDLSVSSCGYDGPWRVWSCRIKDKRVCYLTLPDSYRAVDVLVLLDYMKEGFEE